MKDLILALLTLLLILLAASTTMLALESATSPAECPPCPPAASMDVEQLRSRLAADSKSDLTDNKTEEDGPGRVATSGRYLAIVNGTIIDGSGAIPLFGGTVLIKDDRIVAVGRPGSFQLPSGTRVINAAGKTVMPGLINAHVHYGYDTITRRNFLTSGVTAVCDLGSSLRVMPNFNRSVTLEQESAARGFKSGPIITAPGGYPGNYYGCSWNYDVATPAEGRTAVEDLMQRGSDVIKIALEPGQPQRPLPVLDTDRVRAIVDTAHANNLLVRAHVRRGCMLDIALDAGVDVVEHIPLPFCLETDLKEVLAAGDLYLAEQLAQQQRLERMVEQGVVLVPTLTICTGVVEHLAWLTPDERQAVDDFFLEVVRYYHDRGGVIALGNDYGQPGVSQHLPLAEMDLLLAAGLTRMEVLEAGTRHAARVSGHGHELGVLAPGRLADVIVVNGDPLQDISALKRVTVVIKGGEIAYIAGSI